jgi:hypothetical protein
VLLYQSIVEENRHALTLLGGREQLVLLRPHQEHSLILEVLHPQHQVTQPAASPWRQWSGLDLSRDRCFQRGSSVQAMPCSQMASRPCRSMGSFGAP